MYTLVKSLSCTLKTDMCVNYTPCIIYIIINSVYISIIYIYIIINRQIIKILYHNAYNKNYYLLKEKQYVQVNNMNNLSLLNHSFNKHIEDLLY